jgi:hypothetical protein
MPPLPCAAMGDVCGVGELVSGPKVNTVPMGAAKAYCPIATASPPPPAIESNCPDAGVDPSLWWCSISSPSRRAYS